MNIKKTYDEIKSELREKEISDILTYVNTMIEDPLTNVTCICEESIHPKGKTDSIKVLKVTNDDIESMIPVVTHDSVTEETKYIIRLLCASFPTYTTNDLKIVRIDYDVLLHYMTMHQLVCKIFGKESCSYYHIGLDIDKNLLEGDIEFYVIRYIKFITGSIDANTQHQIKSYNEAKVDDFMIMVLRKYVYYLSMSKRSKHFHDEEALSILNSTANKYQMVMPDKIRCFTYVTSLFSTLSGKCLMITEDEDLESEEDPYHAYKIPYDNLLLNLALCETAAAISEYTKLYNNFTYQWLSNITPMHLINEEWMNTFAKVYTR